ncbi:hypothetical protein B0J18DRAFT_168826 [Chaetomium sp. MPI-SDFR-AT-0129]|nr:hypothetical protein B0J18DRAFT_168826 [Chaetomium sp. MPI-SDFR-AT-0129]
MTCHLARIGHQYGPPFFHCSSSQIWFSSRAFPISSRIFHGPVLDSASLSGRISIPSRSKPRSHNNAPPLPTAPLLSLAQRLLPLPIPLPLALPLAILIIPIFPPLRKRPFSSQLFVPPTGRAFPSIAGFWDIILPVTAAVTVGVVGVGAHAVGAGLALAGPVYVFEVVHCNVGSMY